MSSQVEFHKAAKSVGWFNKPRNLDLEAYTVDEDNVVIDVVIPSKKTTIKTIVAQFDDPNDLKQFLSMIIKFKPVMGV